MALRTVDTDVFVAEGGQFIISLARSGRRAFLVPDAVADWYVTRYGQIKMLTIVLLAASSAGAALRLFSPMWIAVSIAVPFVGVRRLRGYVAERFPPLTDPDTITRISERNGDREPSWAPLLPVIVLGLIEWSHRAPVKSTRLALVAAFAVVIVAALQFAVDRRAHAARQSNRPSSAVTR